jgi:hypothetical protein
MLAAPVARADVKSSEPVDAMEDYYRGERRAGLWLMGMGVAGIGSGAYLTSRDTDFSSGLSYPLLGVGAVHFAAGVYLIFASNRRITKFAGEINDDAGGFTDREYERIGAVKTQFLILKIVESVLIAGGIGLAIYGEREDRPTLTGVGTGLAIESAVTLVFDIVASRRAGRYRRALGGLRVGIAPDDAGGNAVAIGLSGTF